MASDRGKPNGLLIIKLNQVKEFLEPLGIEDLPGIGPKTAGKLRAIKISKIKKLKRLSKLKLKEMFGKPRSRNLTDVLRNKTSRMPNPVVEFQLVSRR